MKPDASRLLSAVADALNACDEAGLKVKLRHGAVWTSAGWVLPLDLKGRRWVARTPVYTEFPAPEEGSDDED